MQMLGALVLIPAVFVMRKGGRVTGHDLNDRLADTGRLLLIFSVLYSVGWIL
jgi:hypothetical protein